MAAAREAGLDVHEPVLVHARANVLVDLAPTGLVARVSELGARAAVEREVDLVGRLASGGAPVAPPASSVRPGPYLHGAFAVTLWDRVEHDPDGPLDARAAGAGLREIHEQLAGAPAAGLDHFLRAERMEGLLGAAALGDEDRRTLRAGLQRAQAFAAALAAPLQPVHGDAHLANVLRTPAGPLWSDFELACIGPRELDLACNEIRARHRGRTADDDAFLEGYGDHDRELVAALVPVHAVFLAALTFAAAERHPDVLPLARERLAWVREAL